MIWSERQINWKISSILCGLFGTPELYFKIPSLSLVAHVHNKANVFIGFHSYPLSWSSVKKCLSNLNHVIIELLNCQKFPLRTRLIVLVLSYFILIRKMKILWYDFIFFKLWLCSFCLLPSYFAKLKVLLQTSRESKCESRETLVPLSSSSNSVLQHHQHHPLHLDGVAHVVARTHRVH